MNLNNHFLIANRGLEDPRFAGSVVYICEHNIDGAMGLIINKPLEDFTLENLLDKLDIDQSNRSAKIDLNQPVCYGGPIAEEHGFVLHTPQEGFSSSILLSKEIMITTSKDLMEILGTSEQPQHILVTLGYSAWSKNQLENEIVNNDWLTVEANYDLLFNTPIDQRWKNAALKLGIDITTMTTQFGHA